MVIVLELNMGIFFDLDGQALIKDTLIFKENENEYELITGIESYGNYILAFENKTVKIYDNDGKFYEKLNIDNNSDFTNKLIVKNKNKIFIATSNKKEEKSKDFKYIIYEIKEVPFENVYKFLLDSGKIEMALYNINKKLKYNVEKFEFLESFYCDCGWISLYKKNLSGYIEAEKYFRLSNINPLELIYHFIKMLKIKPIHTGFQDEKKLPTEVNKC